MLKSGGRFGLRMLALKSAKSTGIFTSSSLSLTSPGLTVAWWGWGGLGVMASILVGVVKFENGGRGQWNCLCNSSNALT